MTAVQKSFSGQQLADLANVEGITFRRYIRSDGTRVGRGKKYSFNAEDAEMLLTGFFLKSIKDITEEDAQKKANELINEEISQVEADTDAETEDTEDDTESTEE